MKKLLFSLILCASLFGCTADLPMAVLETVFDFLSRSRGSSAAWVGKVAPDFSLETLEGESFSLAAASGQNLIILNFFATWCGPCKSEMPDFNEFYNQHKAQGVQLIGIDMQEKESVVRNFVREFQLDFPVGIDKGALRKLYKVRAYPTTVVIDSSGLIQMYRVGMIWDPEKAFRKFL